MADLQEGLDLDTDEGFSAALAAQLGRSEEAPAAEEPAAEEESAQGQPRDDQGRFAEAVAQSEETVEGAASPEAQEETPDPWAEAPPELRAEYERVRREAAEAQSLIGRQGNELGELRQKVEGVEARLETKPEGPLPEIPTATAHEEVENFVAENGGRAAMEWVVENRPDLIDATLKAWAEEDPGEAAIFAGRLAAFEAAQVAAAASAEEPADSRQDQLNAAIVTLQREVKDWDSIKSYLMPALEDASTPTLIKEAVADPDPKRQLEGVRALAEFARNRALAEATGKAISERGEQVAASKTAAQVASGSLRPAPTREPSQESSDVIKAFHERILSADMTSDLLGSIERNK